MTRLRGPVTAETEVQRSRFQALLEPVTEAEAVRARLKELKAAHPEARHVVHAFQIGRPGSLLQGCSDDGEPAGTAGRPALEVLKGQGPLDTAVYILRWFGGIKLGTGGLVKAYGGAVAAVLEAARERGLIEALREGRSFALDWDYPEYEALRRELEGPWQGRLVSETFDAEVHLRAWVPEEAQAAAEHWVRDRSRGRRSLRWDGD